MLRKISDEERLEMALSLEAKQQSIYEIFTGNKKYIIPHYQRAYSWKKEQCESLFDDIKNAFLEKNNGYFLGNFVVANNKEVLEVIDGQQRLITLTLFLRALQSFDENNSALDDAIWMSDRRDKTKKEQRIKTEVFEDKDAVFLEEAIRKELNELCSGKIDNNFTKNICYFYKQLMEFKKINSIEQFSNFLLDDVTLLPIESTDENLSKAREKALKIFETINNRGMPLSDSDIFKANLYYKALNNLEHDEFIKQWQQLDFECGNISLKDFDILRVFRIYSYIVRGTKGTKSSEIGLRDFFTKGEKSIFKIHSHQEIMNELFKIVDSIKLYENMILNPHKYLKVSKWIQIIDMYTNNYPKDLSIIYFYKNNNSSNINNDFFETLVRYCYFQGSTTSIKYTIYDWTVKVMYDEKIFYFPEVDRNYKYFGRLYKGFGLLLAYLQGIETIYPYKIKRLRDVTKFQYSEMYNYDKIGHTVVLDKNNQPLEDYDFNHMDNDSYKQREENLLNVLQKFFKVHN